MMVRTDYMPNNDWTTLGERGRALRTATSTLTGHAIGTGSTPVLDPAIVADVITGNPTTEEAPSARELPEPLAPVVAYLGTDLKDNRREVVPTADLADALDVEPTAFGQPMGELGCRPRPGRVVGEAGTSRQARGYLLTDIHAAIKQALREDPEPDGTQLEPVTAMGNPSHSSQNGSKRPDREPNGATQGQRADRRAPACCALISNLQS
ncbi:MAG: hypothetical protein WCF33_03985 [Pseudonocardiaceae bacterium]